MKFLKSKGLKLGIISDGYPDIQRKKIKALGIENYFNAVIITDEYERNKRKPDPFCFKLILEKLNLLSSNVVFVGNNPRKDFSGTKSLGIVTVRVRRGEYADIEPKSDDEKPDFEVNSLDELKEKFNEIEKF